MAQEKLLGTTVTNGLYTCDALGCVGVKPQDLYDALMRSQEHVEFIGATFGIEGYPELGGAPVSISASADSSDDDDEEDDDDEGDDDDETEEEEGAESDEQ